MENKQLKAQEKEKSDQRKNRFKKIVNTVRVAQKFNTAIDKNYHDNVMSKVVKPEEIKAKRIERNKARMM